MLTGLAPIVGINARALILGSMPSVASLEHQQYYAHPRNAFWPLLARALSFELGSYAQNVDQIKHGGIAVWDVIGQCERPGSLDSAIVKGSEVINPIPALLEEHSSIRTIGLNGGAAASFFKRYCQPELPADHSLKIIHLPSTSPANARMNFDEKCARWAPLFQYITSN